MHKVVQVKWFAINEQNALERIADRQLRVHNLLHNKTRLAQVPDGTVAVRLPSDMDAQPFRQSLGVEVSVHHKVAVLRIILFAEGLVVIESHHISQHVERTSSCLGRSFGIIAPQTLQRIHAYCLMLQALNLIGQPHKILRCAYLLPYNAFNSNT